MNHKTPKSTERNSKKIKKRDEGIEDRGNQDRNVRRRRKRGRRSEVWKICRKSGIIHPFIHPSILLPIHPSAAVSLTLTAIDHQ